MSSPSFLQRVVASPRVRKYVLALAVAYAAAKHFGLFTLIKEYRRRLELFKNLPGPKMMTPDSKEHFLLGHVVEYLPPNTSLTLNGMSAQMVNALMNMMRAFPDEKLIRISATGPWFASHMLGFVLVSDIDTAREVLAHRGMKHWLKGKAYDVSDQLIGQSVLHETGPAWAMQRPVIERGMSHEIMARALPRVLDTVDDMVAAWKISGSMESKGYTIVDAREDMLRLTMDVICKAAFNYDMKSVNTIGADEAPLYAPFQTILLTLNRRIQAIPLHFLRWLPTSENKAFDSAISRLDGAVRDVLEQRMKNPSKRPAEPDLLDIMIAAHNSGELPFNYVLDDVKTMLFAGHDTTGALLAWLLYTLSVMPEVQDRVRNEIHSKYGKTGSPSYDELEEMDVLNALVLEGLRMYPSAGFTRQSDHDVVLAGKYVVPAGTELLVVPYLLQRDPKYWDNPEVFDIDRMMTMGKENRSGANAETDEASFNQGSRTEASNSVSSSASTGSARTDSLQSRIGRIVAKKAFFPFSMGPRNCVGRPLALMEVRVVLFKLIQSFVFSPTDDKEFLPQPLFQLTLNPASIRLKITSVA